MKPGPFHWVHPQHRSMYLLRDESCQVTQLPRLDSNLCFSCLGFPQYWSYRYVFITSVREKILGISGFRKKVFKDWYPVLPQRFWFLYGKVQAFFLKMFHMSFWYAGKAVKNWNAPNVLFWRQKSQRSETCFTYIALSRSGTRLQRSVPQTKGWQLNCVWSSMLNNYP